MPTTRFSYITVLSNWLPGFDRYKNIYSKALLTRSTYPDCFYLLKDDELEIGLNKARSLLAKLGVQGDRIIRIETHIRPEQVEKNTRNGRGWVIRQNHITANALYLLDEEQWVKSSPEDLTALAFMLEPGSLRTYHELAPRTLSVLPVARSCQARCRFCFSESSLSADREKHRIDFDGYAQLCRKAKAHGAERLVITGGGEPGLLAAADLNRLLEIGAASFSKTVLISNGIFLSSQDEATIREKLEAMIGAGLTVLALSCHHHASAHNKAIMGVDSNIPHLLNAIRKLRAASALIKTLKVRLVCVLQKTGISNEAGILDYLEFSREHEVSEVCFKELYVASTLESLYAHSPENKYSRDNRVPLSVLTQAAEKRNWLKVNELPWGSPIYRALENGQPIDVAAYTEPSVGWERHHGIARSWNLLSDGRCYATLEDSRSLIA